MTLAELEAELPNGLHDALLREFSSDLDERRAELVLDVWVGDLHAPTDAERERRSRGRLELLGLAYFVVDAPRTSVARGALVQIDLCAANEDENLARLVPPGGFAGRFFVTEWNAFIHFAALDARLHWLGTN